MLVVLEINDWQKGGSLLKSLIIRKSSSIRELSNSRKEQIANYRFLNNGRVSEEELIRNLATECGKRVSGRHVLCIQDTSEINLNSHEGRLKPDTGVGLIGNNKSIGFFLHPTIVIDAERSHALGFSHVRVWHRPIDKKDKYQRQYQELPIEQKESYKWIESSLASKDVLGKAREITIIEDREGDIYEQFAKVPDKRVHLLIRCTRDRRINTGEKMYSYLQSQESKGEYTLKIDGDIRRNRETREATIEVRYSRVTIQKPKNNKNRSLVDKIGVWVVEARESNPPEGEAPVLWRIITTHKVENFQQACQIVEWYKQRWYIEQVFRLLKQKGVRIEDSELEQGWAIRKLTIMLLNTVLKILQMYFTLKEKRGKKSQKIKDVFNGDEIRCLRKLNKEYEGKTEKQKNKNHISSLRWATWVIARMGGWKGYASQRPPGVLTLKWGIDRFYEVYFGWQLAKKSGVKDVYTP